MHADSNRVPRREGWLAALALAVLLAVNHYDVVFLGRSLITTNYSNPLDYRFLPANYGPDAVPHDEWTRRNLWPYANIRDPGATWWQWEPSTQFLEQAIHDREWPLWDPHIAGGTPAMANLVPAFFFPPYLAVVLLGASVSLLNAYFLLIVWGTSFATFLFIRRHDVGFLPSLMAGTAMMLSGAVQQHLGTFIGQTAACLPVILYVTRRFVDLPSTRRAAALALTFGSVALASFPPVLVAIFGIAALYGAVAIASEPLGATRIRTGLLWAASLAIAMGLVAFYYVPALAARAGTPQVSDLYRDAGLETMPVLHIYQIVSPTLMGGVQTYLNPPIKAPGAPFIPYAGLVVAALSLLARASDRPRRRTLLVACGVALACILLKLFGSPLVQWIGMLPILGEIHIAHYFAIPVGFLAICLAALGAQALADGAISTARAAIVAVIALVFTETLWRAGESFGVFTSDTADYWVRDWRVLAVVTVCAGVAIVMAAARRFDARTRTIAVAGLAAMLAGEGLYNGWFPNPAAWSIFASPPPFVRAVQQHANGDRLFGLGALNANLNSAFGVFTMESLMAFNPPRAYKLYHRYATRAADVFMREPSRVPPETVLDRANVAVVGINKVFGDLVQEASSRGYKRVFDDGFIVLFERATLPKFLFSSDYRVLPAEAALDALAEGDPREIVVERSPGFEDTANLADDSVVQVEWYRRNSSAVNVDAPRAGLLYASESFFDGWTATVNGQPAEILPANYAFRAVVVPAGRSRVVFTYWPPGLTPGIIVSLASAVAALGLVLTPRPKVRAVTTTTPSASEPRTMSAAP